MQSNGRTHLLIVLIFLLVIFIVWFLLGARVIQTEPAAIEEESGSLDVVSQQISPITFNAETSPTILVSTKSGGTFPVSNFLASPATEQLDDNIFLIAEEQSLDGSLYQIFFNRAGGINVTLADPNLVFARQQAETELKELISDSEIQLCALAISVIVPGWLSQQLGVDYSGVDYGLSFCPASLDFDQI